MVRWQAAEPGRTYYHVAPLSWIPGEDLIPLRDRDAFRVRWPEGDADDADLVSLYASLDEAQEHSAVYGGQVLTVRIPEDAPRGTHNSEGYPALYHVPAEWILED